MMKIHDPIPLCAAVVVSRVSPEGDAKRHRLGVAGARLNLSTEAAHAEAWSAEDRWSNESKALRLASGALIQARDMGGPRAGSIERPARNSRDTE